MKKAIIITVIIIVTVSILLAALCAVGYFAVSAINSPEFALLMISMDIKESGMDGLMPHLTDEAGKTVSMITSIVENEAVNSILSFLGKDDYAAVLKSNLKDVEWSLVDILKGNNRADVVLRFNYDGKLIGTVEINMIKDGEWKISGIELPQFEEVNLNN